MLRVCSYVETLLRTICQRLACLRGSTLACDSETKLSMGAAAEAAGSPPRDDEASRSSRRALRETRNARVESPVLLRPPRRRPEHRAPEFAPGDALVAVLVQRVDRAEHVVRAHVHT